jgi:hypothetical protein
METRNRMNKEEQEEKLWYAAEGLLALFPVSTE